jgi:hypothetical protein
LEEETCYEINFEDEQLIKPNEERKFVINNSEYNVRITSVVRIDPIANPNISFDYQLFGVGR